MNITPRLYKTKASPQMNQTYLKLSQASDGEYLGLTTSELEVTPLTLCGYVLSNMNRNSVLLGKVIEFNNREAHFVIKLRLFDQVEHGYSNSHSMYALACVFNSFTGQKVQLRPKEVYNHTELDDGTYTALNALLQDLEGGLLNAERAHIEATLLKRKVGVEDEHLQVPDAL